MACVKCITTKWIIELIVSFYRSCCIRQTHIRFMFRIILSWTAIEWFWILPPCVFSHQACEAISSSALEIASPVPNKATRSTYEADRNILARCPFIVTERSRARAPWQDHNINVVAQRKSLNREKFMMYKNMFQEFIIISTVWRDLTERIFL